MGEGKDSVVRVMTDPVSLCVSFSLVALKLAAIDIYQNVLEQREARKR